MPPNKGLANRVWADPGKGIPVVSIETPSVALEADREGPSFRVGSVETPTRLRSVDDMSLLGDDEKPVPVKLSILMAAYNEERTIMSVVHAILQARFPCEVELIVVDDGSMDATPDLLKEIDDPRVIDLLEQVGRGVHTAVVHDDELDLARKAGLQDRVYHAHDGPLFVVSGHENGQLDGHRLLVITQEAHIIHRT